MATLAVQMGTSIGMLERHYSKLKPYMKLGELGGPEKKASKENMKNETNEMTLLQEILKNQQEQIEKQNKLIEQLSQKLD